MMAMSNQYQISGKVTITEAASVAALGVVAVDGPITVKVETPGPGVRIGNDGLNTVGPNSGYLLLFGEEATFDYVANLSRVYVYAYAAGTAVSWLAKRAGG